MNSTAAIKGFVGRHGGVVLHVVQRQARPDLGVRARPAGVLPARPAPRAATPRCWSWASTLDDCVLYDPHKPDGGLTGAAAARGEDDPLARALLGARTVHHRLRQTRSARGCPASTCWSTPSAGTRWSPPPTTSGSTEYIIQLHRGRSGRLVLGRRHRAESGPPTGQRPSGQGDHVPRPYGLLLLDDEPNRPAASGLGAGGAGRGSGRRTRSPRWIPRWLATPGSPSTRCSPCRNRLLCVIDQYVRIVRPSTSTRRTAHVSCTTAPADIVADACPAQIGSGPQSFSCRRRC